VLRAGETSRSARSSGLARRGQEHIVWVVMMPSRDDVENGRSVIDAWCSSTPPAEISFLTRRAARVSISDETSTPWIFPPASTRSSRRAMPIPPPKPTSATPALGGIDKASTAALLSRLFDRRR
jgi:hypothetical protein